MEIRIAVNELSRALMMLQGVVHKKNTMPILSNVLIKTDESDGVFLSSTDLDVGIRLKRRCEVTLPGAITVSARSLLDVVKMLPGPELVLKSLENHHINIKSGRTNARLVALPAQEFPELPHENAASFQPMKSAVFLAMVHKTLFSTSNDESRYNLTGVFFEPQADDPQSLVMVSTDGHRLSRVKERFSEGDYREFDVVTLPRKGLAELIRLLEGVGAEESFHFALTGNHALVMTKDAFLSMRLIEGKFPDYHQVIPKLSDKIMRASRQEFLLAIKRVSVLASERSQSVKMRIKRGELTVSCVNPDAGEVTDDIAVEYNGPDMEVGFNAKYILDALGAMSDDNILVKFTDPLSPTLITGMENESHQCVIMPMRM
jgi:DNA polymerase-3 subunit beta